jgi:hypothetical protein
MVASAGHDGRKVTHLLTNALKFMADTFQDRLAPLRQLIEATDDQDLLDLMIAVVDVIQEDTARVIDRTHVSRDIAARTKAGDWFGNTELSEILADGDHFLPSYKQQRSEILKLKGELCDRRNRLVVAESG